MPIFSKYENNANKGGSKDVTASLAFNSQFSHIFSLILGAWDNYDDTLALAEIKRKHSLCRA